MIERSMLFNILYGLMARDGREKELFGSCVTLAREAFERSLAFPAFPELWYELPLAGEPWFDLHVGAWHKDADKNAVLTAENTGGQPEAFAWFAQQERDVRQLILSYDVSAGDIDHPATHLLMHNRNIEPTCRFLEVVGRADAAEAYRAFRQRLPKEWFACYAATFPRRMAQADAAAGTGQRWVRVECVLDRKMQRAYASDPQLLEAHLRQTGLTELGSTMVSRCQALAQTPFALEFQFDVGPDGRARPTFGASLRFNLPPGTEAWQTFDAQGPAGELMAMVEGWGLADKRWRLLGDTAVCMRAQRDGVGTTVFSYPTFVKLRWRDGEPLDAKAYLIAGVENREDSAAS